MRKIFAVLLISLVGIGGAFLLNQPPTSIEAPLNRPPLYGLNVDLKSDLKTISDAGFNLIRLSIDLEKEDPAATHAFLDSATRHGLRVVTVLKVSPPIDPHRFSNLVTEFGKRSGNLVDYYQILDEPNLFTTWNNNPNPAEYLSLLQNSYRTLKTIDPTSTIILAALAPTIETGPKNFSDVLYLRALYNLGAKDYFEVVAGKPYGYHATPQEAANANVLNFARLTLLREEMLNHHDGEKFLWASEFGWSNQPSIWGHVTPEQQLQYTREAYQFAQNNWAWAGPLFLQQPLTETQQPFSINLQSLNLQSQNIVHTGRYTPQSLILNHQLSFTGNWLFSELGADIPNEGEATLNFSFVGERLDLTVRRGNYRGYLYATIDGQPANALPHDLNNRAYLVLTSPDLLPRTETITLAQNLTPTRHTAVIHAERGWQQWALVSFTISHNSSPNTQWLFALISLVIFIGLLVLIRPSKSFSLAKSPFQWLAAIVVSLILWVSAGLTWSSSFAEQFRKYGDTIPLIATLFTVTLFYYSPFFLITLLCLGLLFALFYLRPDIGVTLTVFMIPFYLYPKNLWRGAFSMAEICLLLSVCAIGLRLIPPALESLRSKRFSINLTSLDLSVLAFTLVCLASLSVAEFRGVAIREFRVVVLESVLLYVGLRLYPFTHQELWRLIDALVISAVCVAFWGYVDYFITGENLSTAEGGLKRLVSVLGSSNNVALLLGRVLPLTLAIPLMSHARWRRLSYGVAFPFLLGAIILSFSKGALLLGVPLSLATVILFWGGRRATIGLGALAGAGAVAAIPLSQVPRFAETFNFSSGTSFFRVQLWQAAFAMWRDHPLLGVGLDNFLYAYRGKYILPDAWQEPNLPHAHNIFLDALTRLGLLGLGATVWLLAAFFITAFKTLRQLNDPNLRALAIGLIASMVNFLAHGMVDTGFWFVDLAFVFMLTLGVMSKLKVED